jgi:hypothetical protein
MTEQQIIDGNIKIAKWLEWEVEEDYVDTPFLIYQPEISNIPEEKWDCAIKFEKLIFHSDSNWQWLALEKIANNKKVAIGWILTEYLLKGITLNSKLDLFKAILNYINDNKI